LLFIVKWCNNWSFPLLRRPNKIELGAEWCKCRAIFS
jgi:hypothetical protein